jgi:two-component system, cell cycle sensor histidine kinase and response regulator CckA
MSSERLQTDTGEENEMASRRALHILVVDRDETMVEVTIAALERLGFRTQGEVESLKALRTFSDDPLNFDLAIIDPVMPELTGVELAIRFKRIRMDFPILFYSGFIDPSLVKTIEDAGLGQALLRPLWMKELEEAVRGAARPIDIQ